MRQDLNTFAGTGRLAKDPELQSGETTICRLRLASNRLVGAGDKRDEKVSFLNVTVFGASAKACAEYLRKGSQVAIHGRVEERRFKTRSGDNGSRIVIVADTVNFLDPPARGGQEKPQSTAASAPPATPRPVTNEPPTAPSNFGKRRGGRFDEEMPF